MSRVGPKKKPSKRARKMRWDNSISAKIGPMRQAQSQPPEPIRESRMQDIILNQNDNTSRMWNIVARMGQLADRIVGPLPEPTGDSNVSDAPSAMIDKISLNVHTDGTAISRLEEQIARLEVL